MLHTFIDKHRDELIIRCQRKAAKRDAPRVTVPINKLVSEPGHGVPIFLNQLGDALRTEEANPADKGKGVSGSSAASLAESKRTSSLHGKTLFDAGYSIDQVVHGYGDVCQSITELAGEVDAPVTVEEFHTLNRMLDNAIADSVTSYAAHRDKGDQKDQPEEKGGMQEELRAQLVIASTAFNVLESGQTGIGGATGLLLKKSLETLAELVEKSFAESPGPSATPAPPKARHA